MSPLMSAIMRMLTIMITATFGNIFLIFVICRGNSVFRQRISPVQLLLLHTCFADLLFALLSIGSEILILLTLPIFYAPDVMCRLVRYLQALPLYASPFLLVAISVDRYQAICRPLVHYTSDRFRRPNCLGLSAWALALLCSVPQLFIWHKSVNKAVVAQYKSHPGMDANISALALPQSCSSVYDDYPIAVKQAYVLWFSTVAWLLPSLISAIFYYKVCSTVWKSRFWGSSDNLKAPAATPTKKAAEGEGNSLSSCRLTQEYVEGLRKSSTGIRNQISEFDRKRIQTVRLTLTIVFCNFFLWLPFCVINVIQAFAPAWATGDGKAIINQISILGNLNACVNPWIYILFNKKIMRRALGSVIRKKGSDSPSASGGTRQTSLGYRLTVASHHNHKANGQHL